MSNIPSGLKVTPLYPIFEKLGGHFTEFGGYYMPLNFKEGIIHEHQAVRTNVGLFDVSHMGEIRLTGKDASPFLNYVSTNNINKITNSQVQYHLLCLEDGGVIDDMLAYKFDNENLLLVCNASNQEIVYNHLEIVLKNHKFDVKLTNEGEMTAVISLQGPDAKTYLDKEFNDIQVEYMSFINSGEYLISKTGYTGEDGFEIYGTPEAIYKLTEKLLNHGVTPCGLGARDTLRFEAGLPLFGHEISNLITPVEAGLNFAIDFEKENFIGKQALVANKEKLSKKVVGLILLDKGIAREGYLVYDGNKIIGHITSGFMIPGTKTSYANALINNDYQMGDIISIEIRNKKIDARIRSKRYIKKNKGEKR